jgi:hypothetical protein
LELIDPTSDNARGESWKASVGHGSPGRKNSITSAIDDTMNKAIPDTYALMQNYPNPFNPTTAISFQLSAVSFVRLSVYDVLGKEVATLVNRELTAGIHTVSWDAHDLPSGVYVYRIVAGNYVASSKMLFLK